MAATYHAPPAGVLRIVALDVLSAAYDRRSGMTHVVAPPVPEILDVLAQAPTTLDALLLALGERYDLEDADPAILAGRLDELVACGLIERRGG